MVGKSKLSLHKGRNSTTMASTLFSLHLMEYVVSIKTGVYNQNLSKGLLDMTREKRMRPQQDLRGKGPLSNPNEYFMENNT